MKRIDSHQHYWRVDRNDYGWLHAGLKPIYRDFLPEHLAPLLARAGVEATILVQAAPTVAETHFLLELARTHEHIAGVVGWVDFTAPTAAELIAELAANPQLVGLRPMLQDIPDIEWVLGDALAPALEAMVRHGLVFDALVRTAHLPAIRELCARYPELTVVIDHGAKPAIAAGDLSAWMRAVASLARASDVRCKLSGLVTEADTADVAALAPSVRHLLECFGPQRLMWGSDWPVCELVCSYADWDDVSHALLGELGAAEQAAIFAEVARDTYGI